MEYSMEFHGTCVVWNGALLILWYPMDLGDFFYDFLFGDSRVPWNIPWKSRVTGHKMTISKFPGIPWNYLIQDLAAPKFHVIPWNVPWNSMEPSDMSFGGTRVPWNSMEYSMEFHGTNWYFIWRQQSSMVFHGIFHGIFRSVEYSLEVQGNRS